MDEETIKTEECFKVVRRAGTDSDTEEPILQSVWVSQLASELLLWHDKSDSGWREGKTMQHYILNYAINRWTYPIKSSMGILAFKRADQARRFAKLVGVDAALVEIYRSKAQNPRLIRYTIRTTSAFLGNEKLMEVSSDLLSKYEKEHDKQTTLSYIVGEAPPGTMACDALMLLEQII